MKSRSVLCFLGLGLLSSGLVLANETLPSTPREFHLRSPRIGFHMPMLFGENSTALSPKIDLAWPLGAGHFAFHLPMASFNPDHGDDQFALGNPTLEMGYRGCTAGRNDICLAGNLGLGFGLWELDDKVGLFSFTSPEAWARWGGVIGHQGLLYYLGESFVIRPAIVLSLHSHNIFFEGKLGTEIEIPAYDTDTRDTEAYLSFQLGLGLLIHGMFAPMVQFSGMTALSDTDWSWLFENAYWLNLGLRVETRYVQPFVRMGIGLDHSAEYDDSRFQLELGTAITF